MIGHSEIRQATGDTYESAPLHPTHTRMVTVGGHRPDRPQTPGGWDRPRTIETDNLDRGDAHPVVDRRRRPRAQNNRYDAPAPSLVPGAVFALVALVAIGYLVYELL